MSITRTAPVDGSLDQGRNTGSSNIPSPTVVIPSAIATPPIPKKKKIVFSGQNRDQNPWTRVLLAIGAPFAVAIRCMGLALSFLSGDAITAISNLASGITGIGFVQYYNNYVDRKAISKEEKDLNNSWSRSYKTGAIVWGYLGILISGILISFTTIPFVGNVVGTFLIGLAFSGAGAFGGYLLRKQFPNPVQRLSKHQTKGERWVTEFEIDNAESRLIKSGAMFGNSVGALVGLLIPGSSFITVAIGGAIGGLVGAGLGYLVKPFYAWMTTTSAYKYFYPDVDDPVNVDETSSSNNPCSVRIRGGMQWGANWGALVGTLIFPGIGPAVGTLAGTVVGGLIALIAEPLRLTIPAFKSLMPYRTANPWAGRLRAGAYIGMFIGGAIGTFIPGGILIGTALGGIITGFIGLIAEPLYLYFFHHEKLTRLTEAKTNQEVKDAVDSLRPDLETKSGNPWNAQVSVVAAIGSAIGFFLPIPGGMAFGGVLGALVGAVICYFANKTEDLTSVTPRTLTPQLPVTPTVNSSTASGSTALLQQIFTPTAPTTPTTAAAATAPTPAPVKKPSNDHAIPTEKTTQDIPHTPTMRAR